MLTNYPRKITMIGAGNVATHLALALRAKGFEILQVYSRTEESASRLATLTDASYTTNPDEISSESGLNIISVSDNAIEEILEKVSFGSSLVVHTSGSIPMKVFKNKVLNYGVLYPLQTFSKERQLNYSDIPLCIEANSSANLEVLNHISTVLSKRVVFMTSQKRLSLHLAAVIACNFSNHLYTLAKSVLDEKGLSFDLLTPLIMETTGKAIEFGPEAVQTGPAIRNDVNVIEKHLELLSFSPELKEIYLQLSKNIRETHSKNIDKE
jgi:predicted short-subunit dehydrogenase-like oxidoreductase (DUF2520 family)